MNRRRSFRASRTRVSRIARATAAWTALGVLLAPAALGAQSRDAGNGPPNGRSPQTPEQAIEATVRRGFPNERLAVRTRVAAASPDSAAGLYARGWLALRAGDKVGAVRLADQCLQRSASYEPCIGLHTFAFDGSQSDAELHAWADPILARAPFADGIVASIYMHLHDRAAAASWLAALESQHPRNYAFEYARGIEAASNNANDAALAHFRRALFEREGAADEVVESALTAAMHLPPDMPGRRDALGTLLSELERTESSKDLALAYLVAGHNAADLGDRRGAVELLTHSNALSASPDAADMLFDQLVTLPELETAHAVVVESRRQFPDEPMLMSDEGRWYAIHDYQPARAEQSYRQAVQAARDAQERAAVALRYVWDVLEPNARYREARDLLAAIPHAPTDTTIWRPLYDDLIRSGDLAGARQMLDQFHDQLTGAREVYFLTQRERLLSYTTEPLATSAPDSFSSHYLAATRDGRLFSSGSAPVVVYDAATGHAVFRQRRGGTREFSPDGRYLAAASNFVEQSGERTMALFIYEVSSGRLVRYFDLPAEAFAFAWKPDSTRLAWYDANGFITEYDFASQHCRVIRGSNVRIPGRLTYSGDGRYLISGAAQANVLHVWRADTLALERDLTGVQWTHALASTPDGRYIVAVDNDANLVRYDTTNWSQTSVHLDAPATGLTPHPSEPVFLLHGSFRDHVGVFDARAMRMVHQLPMVNAGGAAFLGPHRILAEQAYSLQTIDYPSMRVLSTRAIHRPPTGPMVALAGARVAVRDGETISVRDPANDAVVRRWRVGGEFAALTDGSAIVAVDGGAIHRLDPASSADHRARINPGFTIQSISVGQRLVAVGGVRGADPTGEHETPAWGSVAVYEIETGRQVWRHDVPVVSEESDDNRLYRSAIIVALDEGNERVATSSSAQQGYGRPGNASREVQVWQVGGVNPLQTFSTGIDVQRLSFDASDDVIVSHLSDFESYSIARGQRVASGQHIESLPDGRQLLTGAQRAEVLDAHGHVVAAQDFDGPLLDTLVLPQGGIVARDNLGQLRLLRLDATAAH